MARIAGPIAGALAVVALMTAVAAAAATMVRPPTQPGAARVYSVAQFVHPGTGPLWTTNHKTVFLIRGVLLRAPLQPVADFVLVDSGSGSRGEGGLALAAGPRDPMVSLLRGVGLPQAVLPHTPDNPLLGAPATYRVGWDGCPSHGCARSPWRLVSGGE